MLGVGRRLFLSWKLHTLSRDGPTESLKKKVEELDKIRKRTNVKKDQVFVEVPEAKTWFDTATMPMNLIVAAIALFAKLLMMGDLKDWTIDVFTDALTRGEECAKHDSS